MCACAFIPYTFIILHREAWVLGHSVVGLFKSFRKLTIWWIRPRGLGQEEAIVKGLGRFGWFPFWRCKASDGISISRAVNDIPR